MTVLRVDARDWRKDTGETVVTYWVLLLGRDKEVACYDSRAQDLKVGEALPEGWTIAQSKAGKDYLKPPAKQGSAKREYVPRFTDTEVGWRANDERVDRRAALAAAQAEGSGITTELAEKFYSWLRKTVPASGIEGHGGIGHPTARGKDSRPDGSNDPRPDERGEPKSPRPATSGSPPRSFSEGTEQRVSARGESDSTVSAPHGARGEPETGALGGVVETRGGTSTDAQPDEALASDSDGVGGADEREHAPADTGKVPGAPACLHLKGVFTKNMANGDRVEFCLACKQRLEVVSHEA